MNELPVEVGTTGSGSGASGPSAEDVSIVIWFVGRCPCPCRRV